MRDFELWSLTNRKLQTEVPVVLLIVASHRGSSPGKQGFKMLITGDGEQIGSIGGGVMELNMIRMAEQILEEQEDKAVLQVQDHHTKAPQEQQSGLICSGSQTNILVRLHGEEDTKLVSEILSCYGHPQRGYITIRQQDFEFTTDEVQDNEKKFVEDENWYYQERVGDPFTIHMFGAGHVGRAITQILRTLDFYIILYDNRENLEMMENNPYPHRKVTGEYPVIAKEVPKGQKSFVIIATFGMEHDAEVLEQVVDKNLGYLGLMGSKTKIRNIFERMREKGVSQEKLERIEAPIGIPINDETAEEIAISISAQLVKYKNDKTGDLYFQR